MYTEGTLEDKPSLREEHAEAVRDRLFQAATELIEAGEEPTMRAVAKQAAVSERTIYRYYPSRDDLMGEVRDRLQTSMGTPLCESIDELEGYVARLFGSFSANAQLIQGLVHAPWAAQSFAESRTSNLAKMQALIDRGFPEAPVAARRKAARALRVALSGASWGYLTDCGLSEAEVTSQGQWLVRAVIESLESSARCRTGKRRKIWKRDKR